MRVGIFGSAAGPQHGGQYVFEHAVLDALAGGASNHELRCYVDSAQAWSGFQGMPLTALDRSPAERVLGKLERSVEVVRQKLKQPRTPWTNVESSRARYASERVRQDQVELLWSLAPETITLEVPFVVTLFDLQHRLQPFFPEVSADGEWERRERHYQKVLPRAAAVVVGTERGREEACRFYALAPERVRVIPFPTPSFALAEAPAADPLAGLDLPQRFLFYPAQFWPHKNHVGLLHALKRLREHHGRDLALVLSGSDKGNADHVMREAAALGLSEVVHSLGFVSQEQLAALYRRAVALCFPSLFGPDNLPPLEAFALGCPVVAADVPGASEQLGAAALRVAPGDGQAMGDAVERLLSEEGLRETLVRRGRERASAWTCADYARRVFDVLDELEPFVRCWPVGGAS